MTGDGLESPMVLLVPKLSALKSIVVKWEETKKRVLK